MGTKYSFPKVISRDYTCNGKNSSNGSPKIVHERMYQSHTDYTETRYVGDDGVTVLTCTEKLERLDEDVIWAANNAKQMEVQLTGEVTGKAQCDDNWKVKITTKPSKKYVQKIVLEGQVVGEAVATTFDSGVATIDCTIPEIIPNKVVLTGAAYGTGTVTPDHIINITTKVDYAQGVILPKDSIQFSLNPAAEQSFKTCYGGTWQCIGNVDVYLSDDSNTILIYIYKKITTGV